MSARAVGVVALGASVISVLALSAKAASACRLLPMVPHHVQPELAGVDTSAPGVPQVLEVAAFRRTGMTCTEVSCVANTCGDTGTVRIDLAPAVNDSEPVGYRLIAVSGAVPASIAPMLGVDLAGGAPLYLRPSFEEIGALDLSLRAVAIDAAGNESEPTEAFRVQFDGCTLAAVGDSCEDDVDPAEDLSALIDGTGVAEGGEAIEASGASCSFGSAGSSSGLPLAFVALGAASIALRRRRS